MVHANLVTLENAAEAEMSVTPTESENIDYFVICAAHEIGRREARAFDLAERSAEGQPKPLRILIARNAGGDYFAYRNACPHQNAWLNINAGKFFDETGALLQCGRHGAKFETESGNCVSGACEGAKLEKLSLAVLDGDICLHGVDLLEDDHIPGHDDDMDETMEITISSD